MMCFRIENYENVSGGYLDTPADLALQFAKTNILFAFDNVECERTTAFTLPSTPQNDLLLGFANDTHNPNAYAATHTLQATLEGDSVTKSGYIYVQRCSEDSYECVFVCGDLLGLKTIKELGKIGDILATTDKAKYGAGQAIDASQSTDKIWQAVKYGNMIDGYSYPFPSLNLYLLASRLQNAGVKVSRDGIRAWRVIPGTVAIDSTTTMAMQGVGMPSEGGGDCGMMMVTDYTDKFTTVTQSGVALGAVMNSKTSSVTTDLLGNYQLIMPREDISVTFPDTLSATICLVSHMSFDGGVATLRFLGDYTYTPPRGSIRGGFNGTPLAGRTIDIPRNQAFLIYDFSAGYHEDTVGDVYTAYFDFESATIDTAVTIGFATSQAGTVPLQPYLPDMTVVELYKNIAALQGDFIVYRDGRLRIMDDEAIIAGMRFRDMTDRLLSMTAIERTFGDFAQSNFIEFDSSASVTESERLRRVYSIDNNLIEEENTLQTIAWSEATYRYTADGNGVCVLQNDKPTISASLGGKVLQRADIGRNRLLDQLTATATKCQVSVRMPLYEFDAMTESDGILVRNQRWVWLSAQWSDGVATMIVQLYTI